MVGYYLKPSVKIEPLVCGWYVFPHLVPPLQLAMNLNFRFLPILESFCMNPQLHYKASQDPALLGGPFVNLAPTAVSAVKELIAKTQIEAGPLLRFAKAFRAVDTELQQTAAGEALDRFYSKLPDEFGGLIEFAYDANHHPSARLLEELIYLDGLAAEQTQEIVLHTTTDAKREMFISTPQLARDDRFFWKIPFTDSRIDQLVSLRKTAAPIEEIRQLLGIPADIDPCELEQFLTQEEPDGNDASADLSGVRVRYFGHACVLLQTRDVSILVDPLVAYERETPTTLTMGDLPDTIDYVLITHAHQDHLCPEILLQIRSRVKNVIVPKNTRGSISDPSPKLIFQALGYRNVREVDLLETVQITDGEIVPLPFSGEQCGLDISAKHSLLVNLKGKKFLFLADSEAMDPALYDRMAPIVGHAEMIFLGMECDGAPVSWFYGPLMTKPLKRDADSSRKANGSNSERAASILEKLSGSQVYIYAMGMESWTRYLLGLEYGADSVQIRESDRLIDWCRSRGMVSERLNGTREWTFDV